MDILTGMSGLKTATDLLRSLRDALKSGQIKPDEVAGRIGEIYDYIVESKDALVDAKDEIQELKDKLSSLEHTKEVNDSLEFDGKVYWKKDDPDHPFCPTCWDVNKQLVRLSQWDEPAQYGGVWKTHYRCHVHKLDFFVRASR